MNPNRFDTLAKQVVERRLSRRTALAGTGATLAAAALGLAGHARARDATPVLDTDTIHPGAGWVKPTSLFTQTFDAGTWQPKPGQAGTYTLTLQGASAETVGFTDRPEWLVGMAPTQAFLDKLGFTPSDPPNAALVAAPTGGGTQDILVIELFNPVYDASAKILTYEAKILADYSGTGLAALAKEQQDFSFASSFGAGGLFIDDCPDGTATCYGITNGQKVIVGNISNVGCCANPVICDLCNGDGTSWYYGMLCHEAYPNQCNYYSNGINGWTCYGQDLTCGITPPGE